MNKLKNQLIKVKSLNDNNSKIILNIIKNNHLQKKRKKKEKDKKKKKNCNPSNINYNKLILTKGIIN